MTTPRFSLRIAALAAIVLSAGLARGEPAADVERGPKFGLQTWTCRNMTFEQIVDFAVRHKIKYLEFIPQHFDPTASREETLRKKAILEQHGLVAYSFGVNRVGLDKEANRKLFEFARLMGMKVIVVEPTNPAAWDNLEELVKEYDIKLAIHNHNRGTAYGDPAAVKKVLAARDRRIGVCLDIGWVTAAGFDAAEVFREYGDRVYDMHFKDKIVEMSGGKSVAVDTEIGRGQANYEGLFAEIRRSGWSGVLAVETDSMAFARDPNRLVSDAKAFFDAHVLVDSRVYAPDPGIIQTSHFFLPYSGQTQILPSEDPSGDGNRMRQKGYALLGSGTRPETRQTLEEQAKAVGADIVLTNNQHGATYWRKRVQPTFGVLGVQKGTGYVVSTIVDGSPAFRANLLPGDVLIALGDSPIESAQQYESLLTLFAGKRVAVTFLRDGMEKKVTVQLNSRASK